MLKNTFLHIPGIGEKTEKRLWNKGCSNWDAFVEPYSFELSPSRTASVQEHLEKSRRHLENNHSDYFAELLPTNSHWRMFPEFRHCTAYLDIETTGLNALYDEITVIGLYDGDSISYYVKDQNLDDFREDIEKYEVIITYNGKCFDIPFIRSHMGLSMDQTHIDLRYVLGSLGFSGGLKGCETKAGIDRGELTGLDGYDAVLLWNEYRRTGDQKVLETLIAYNLQDVINLEVLMVMANNLKLNDTPFLEANRLQAPVTPVVPFKGDSETIDRIDMGKRSALNLS